jgi:hypothetical protein
MKKTDLEALLAIAGLIMAWLFIDNVLKRNKLAELQKEIDENKNLNSEIRSKLKELIENNKEVEPKIASELGQIVALLEIKQDSTAVFKLAKIIENLLKELYKEDPGIHELAVKNGRKSPSFADYLDYAKVKQVITQEDFHLLSVLKIIRNQEGHELAVKKEKSLVLASFVAGMSLILKLCRILHRKEITYS